MALRSAKLARFRPLSGTDWQWMIFKLLICNGAAPFVDWHAS
jgi:hypothetical protein